jgi:UPF0755 protein
MVWLRRLTAALLALVVLAVLAVAAGWWLLERYLDQPGPLAQEEVIELPRGSGLAAIAGQLEAAGVIEDARVFRVAARVIGRDRRLRAGEYRIPADVSPREVLDILESGQIVLHALTIPEGLSTVEALAVVEAHSVLVGDMPEEPPGEGQLLPETYMFARGTTRTEIVERMQSDMAALLAELWETRQEGLPLENPEEALILASIIEKETAVPDEYGLVAGVFVNRLRRGMLLQTDPTVIYAITRGQGPLGRQLLRRDLEVDDPYNTYRYPGLPPGPIANPGRGALEAALDPAETDYLYFVADGTGGHAFAKTLAEHNRNAARWRRIRDGGG